MKQKSFFVGLAIAAIVLFIFSLTAVTKVISANPRNLEANLQPQAAQFLPKRSPLVASFLVNPDRLSLAAKLATKVGDRRSHDQEITNLKTQLQQTWRLNYDLDLKPWLGSEVTLAVTNTDLDRDSSNGLQAGYLIAMSAKQPDLAQKYLDKFWQKQAQSGSDLVFEQYQGVSLISTKFLDNFRDDISVKAIANAKIGKFILFANDPSIIRNAINNLQAPNLALARNEDYLNSLKQVTEQGFAIAYLNPREILGDRDQKTEAIPITSDLPVNLMMGFKTSDLGITAETILALVSPVTLPQSVEGSDILKYISTGSSLLIGNDLAQTITNIADRQRNPILEQVIQKLEKSLDFTLALDSLNWITDRYAIAIPAINESLKDSKTSNWLLIAENKNPELVKSALLQLDRDAHDKSKFTIGEIVSNDQTLTLWTKLNPITSARTITGKVALAHTEVTAPTGQKYVFISDSVPAIEAALSSPSIYETDPIFKAIASSIGTENGLIYLNARDLHNFLALKSPLSFLQDRLQSLAIGNTKIISSSDATFLNSQSILNWTKPKF